MTSAKSQRDVENRVRDALQPDRARVQVGRISRFGLLEMSRQRLRPSLDETSASVCPRCSGQGTIRDTKSLALSILRLIEEAGNKDRSAEIRAIVPVDVASYLLNEKRAAISAAEERTKVRILIIPSNHLETPHFELKRLRDDEIEDEPTLSFQIQPEVAAEAARSDDEVPAFVPQKAAVQFIAPTAPAPTPTVLTVAAPVEKKQPGLFGKFISILFGETESAPKTETTAAKPSGAQRTAEQRRGGQRTRGGRGRGRNERGRSEGRPERDEPRTESREPRAPQERRPQQERPAPAAAVEPVRNEAVDGSEDRPQRRPGNRRPRGPGERTRAPVAAETSIEHVDADVNGNVQEQEAPQSRPEGSERPRRERQRRPRGERRPQDQAATADQEAVTDVGADSAAAIVPSATTAPTPPVQLELVQPTEAMPAAIVEPTPVIVVAAQEISAPNIAAAIAPVEPAAPVVVVETIAPAAIAPAPAVAGGRASNDPRINKREVAPVAVSTETLRVEMAVAPAAQPDPKSEAVTRASNDPRQRRNADQQAPQ